VKVDIYTVKPSPNRPWRLIGFWDVEDATGGGALYSPETLLLCFWY
jgi:hypothetical protein